MALIQSASREADEKKMKRLPLRLDVGVPGEAAGGVPAEEADTVDEDAATVPA